MTSFDTTTFSSCDWFRGIDDWRQVIDLSESSVDNSREETLDLSDDKVLLRFGEIVVEGQAE